MAAAIRQSAHAARQEHDDRSWPSGGLQVTIEIPAAPQWRCAEVRHGYGKASTLPTTREFARLHAPTQHANLPLSRERLLYLARGGDE